MTKKFPKHIINLQKQGSVKSLDVLAGKNKSIEQIQYHNFEKHMFSLEDQVGFHFSDADSTTHVHNGFLEFSLIVSGEWEHIFNGKKSRLTKDTLIFLNNNTMHTLRPCSKGCNHFTFFFKEEYFKNFLNNFFPNNTSLLTIKFKETVLTPNVSTFLLYEAHKMVGTRTSYNHKIEFQNYMHNLIYFMFFSDNVQSDTSDCNKYGYCLRKYFDNYLLLNDTLKNVYCMFPVCPATLIKQFENETGQTISQYRNDKRMEYASILLKDWRLTVIDVANKVGISSPSHFAAEFKKKFGISPKEFSKRHGLLK